MGGIPRRKKLRPVEKPVRPIEDRNEGRSVRRMRDMDVAARPPHEVACTAAPIRPCDKLTRRAEFRLTRRAKHFYNFARLTR
jgi:hypothetical protein